MARDEEEIPVEGEVESEEEFSYQEDSGNLVDAFIGHQDGVEALRGVSKFVLDTFDQDWEASEEYREQRASDWQIFSGLLPKKSFPFEHAANAHIPLMLENLSRLVFRAKGELIGDGVNIIGVSPVGPDDKDVAEILSKHGNWQITEDIPDFMRQMDRGLLLYFLHGDVTAQSYRDSDRRQNRHEILTSDEFVVPYVYVSTMPDYSDCPHYSRVLRYHRHEVEAMRGVWYAVDEVLEQVPPTWDEAPEAKLREGQSEVDRITTPDDDSSAPYKLIEWFGWMDLPNQDRQRFCRVVVDYHSKHVMQLNIHEEPDWRERIRFDRQQAEREGYMQARAQYEHMTQMASKTIGEAESMQEGAGEVAMGMVPEVPEPVMPTWMDEPGQEPPAMKKRPIHMFSHGVCIEPLTGALGMGYGQIQADLNRAANVALSQFTDQATLSNAKGLIVSPVVKFKDEFSWSPGKINTVTGMTGDDLRKHIMPMEPGPANPQLFDLVRFMMEVGQSSVQSPNVLSGEPGKSGETFRGISARIEQATKQLSVATRKYADFMKQVFRNNARLNAIFMDEEELVMVNNHLLGMSEEITVGRALYQRDYRVFIRADLKYTSEAAKAADADALLMGAMQIPQLQMNNALIWALTKQAFEARDQHHLVPLLGPQPPITGMQPPMPPQGMPGPSGPGGPAPEGPPQ